MKINEYIDKIVCPQKKNKLKLNNNFLTNEIDSNIKYPILNEIPILIDEQSSFYKVSKIVDNFDKENKSKKILKYFLPNISLNLKSKKNFNKINKMLNKESKILIIGGGTIGSNSEIIIHSEKKYFIITTDIYYSKNVDIINDAHNLCFADKIFDCVIIQAVLEHVLEPHKCVSEIHRVLKDDGIIYAETPFMQQVHMKQYDFTRFTALGHLWLFKNFKELDSGPCSGPAMALAWAWLFFLRSFSNNKIFVLFLTFFGRLTSFFLKYLDYFLINKKGGYDAASGFYFIGKKADYVLKKYDLLKRFKGN